MDNNNSKFIIKMKGIRHLESNFQMPYFAKWSLTGSVRRFMSYFSKISHSKLSLRTSFFYRIAENPYFMGISAYAITEKLKCGKP